MRSTRAYLVSGFAELVKYTRGLLDKAMAITRAQFPSIAYKIKICQILNYKNKPFKVHQTQIVIKKRKFNEPQ